MHSVQRYPTLLFSLLIFVGGAFVYQSCYRKQGSPSGGSAHDEDSTGVAGAVLRDDEMATLRSELVRGSFLREEARFSDDSAARVDKFIRLARRVTVGDIGVRVERQGAIEGKLDAADVVFIGEHHQRDSARTLLVSILRWLATRNPTRRVDVLLEAVEHCHTEDLRRRRDAGVEDWLVGLIQSRQNSSVEREKYRPVQLACAREHVHVFAIGGACGTVIEDPPAGTPSAVSASENPILEFDRLVSRTNDFGVLAARSAEAAGAFCVIICGALHAYGPHGMVPRMQELGLTVVALLPDVAEIELAALERFRRAPGSSWVRLAEGVYSPALQFGAAWK